MTVSEARAAAAAALAELPQQVHDALEHVSVRVVDFPPEGIPSDVKGIFLGQQQKGDPDADDDDDQAGEWYDVDPENPDELVEAEFGGYAPARGQIVIVAGNLLDADDVARTLYHETGHALGMSEEDVAELGLE